MRPLGRGGRAAPVAAGRGSAKVRRELGGDQVEGRQAVRELLAAHRRPVHEVWMMEGSDPAAILREIQSLARAGHVPVRLVTPRQIQQVQGSEAPQGVIAFAEALEEADLSDLVGLASADVPGPKLDEPGRALFPVTSRRGRGPRRHLRPAERRRVFAVARRQSWPSSLWSTA